MATCGLERSFQQTISNNCTNSLLFKKTVPTPDSSDYFVEREFFIRSIVFGAEKTGKHALIASNFLRDRQNAQTYARFDRYLIQFYLPYLEMTSILSLRHK